MNTTPTTPAELLHALVSGPAHDLDPAALTRAVAELAPEIVRAPAPPPPAEARHG